MNRSKRANHFGTICEKRMARKRRFDLERASWHDARFGNGTPVEIKSTMLEHSNGQPGNFKIYREYHKKLRRHEGWYCFAVYRPHGRSGLTIVRDKMVRACDLPLLRWHGGGDHRGTKQGKISISDVF
ncbi:hypothetical protein [Halopiger aswanensis]|uniref:Protein NO VEIN C-terminal domain-containing protein n=1 Tax=Halopiger aswanensis TaxID=148449 RepID=A0A3R7DDH5_9EURY|nr:hypothetical protein [Halopiger aswanensis]RKD95500.1 hypothetical protein ATJ93_2357 [Halopiger aswanensis]